MAMLRYAAAAAFAATCVAAFASPTMNAGGSASVRVIGSSDARLCFEAAELPGGLRPGDLLRCDDAIRIGGLTSEELAATHVNRGILRIRRGQIDAAIADFDAALAIDPDQPEAYLNKGFALMRRDRPGEALGLFTVAIERATNRPEVAHYGRATAHEALGDARAAYYDYRRASELAPEWREPLIDLARFRVIRR